MQDSACLLWMFNVEKAKYDISEALTIYFSVSVVSIFRFGETQDPINSLQSKGYNCANDILTNRFLIHNFFYN